LVRLRQEAAERARREAAQKAKRDREDQVRKEAEAAEQRAREEREHRDKMEAQRRAKEATSGASSLAQGLDLDNLTIEPWNPRGYDNLEQNLVGPDKIPRGVEKLNRYINILPNPKTRVRLRQLNGAPQSTYINGNFIAGHNGDAREYIATQGPTKETALSFWRMVWEQDSRAIVMVTGIVERGIDKCFRYVPMPPYFPTDPKP
jgi:protein tyrosine phosphatase